MMKILSKIMLSLVILTMPLFVAYGDDGTREGAVQGPGAKSVDQDTVRVGSDGSYTIKPFESVSISPSNVWKDNRHRAYYSSEHVNGFLLFDVSAIPDTDKIVSMTLRCYLENAYGSPYSNPVVDVYYSADDGWTRASATPGSLSLDKLLVNDILFTTYIPQYDFVLDVSAHDWSVDLLDNRICIGFTNDVTHYSYVYFFGAYGSPVGPPPELMIKTVPALPLTADTDQISASTGGRVTFTLDAGAGNGNRNYILLGSASGTTPGISLPGGMATLPLNWDVFTNVVISLINTSIFSKFMATLDPAGGATAIFDTLGPIPGASGITLHFAYALNKPWDFASNPVGISIVP